MNREIKFRIFDKNIPRNQEEALNESPTGEIVEWENVLHTDYLKHALTKNEYPIMQYTGLKDKNGKEIYEDDIVRKGNKIYYVSFCMGSFELRKKSDSENCATGRRNNTDWMLLEIIGNIYENPELLTQK
jgi:uncharacterized phage protein (TIGR01671 family)